MEEEKKVENRCSSSHNCGNEGTEPRTCPYQEEINNDYETLCNCCESCQQECVWDI